MYIFGVRGISIDWGMSGVPMGTSLVRVLVGDLGWPWAEVKGFILQTPPDKTLCGREGVLMWQGGVVAAATRPLQTTPRPCHITNVDPRSPETL